MPPTPTGFFRFGAACSADQKYVRLDAIKAFSEVNSVFDHQATIHVWLSHSNHPMSIQYGARSAAELDHRNLKSALDSCSPPAIPEAA